MEQTANNALTDLLTKQSDLCRRSIDAFRSLAETIANSTSGAGVTAAVQNVEPMLSELTKLSKDTEVFLQQEGYDNLYDAVKAQPNDEVMRLFTETNELQQQLKSELTLAFDLMKRSKLFVDFHINVLTHVRAENTYGHLGNTGVAENVSRKRKMFDAKA